jgi:hypothetical protein
MRAILLTVSPNGADVTVKDTKRYADTHGWGYYNFNQHEPEAQTAKVRVKEEMHLLRFCQCQERCQHELTKHSMSPMTSTSKVAISTSRSDRGNARFVRSAACFGPAD